MWTFESFRLAAAKLRQHFNYYGPRYKVIASNGTTYTSTGIYLVEIDAEEGSTVHAYGNAVVNAKKGSVVYKYIWAVVYAEEGATVIDKSIKPN